MLLAELTYMLLLIVLAAFVLLCSPADFLLDLISPGFAASSSYLDNTKIAARG
jgi:hypothetical protein